MEIVGWIKIQKKLLDWEWYHNGNVFRVFLHCLLKANYEDKKWQGILIKRGEFISSYPNIAEELKLSVMQVRTSLNKLKLTGELTVKTTNKYSHIQILNYNNYQTLTDKSTVKQHSNNIQITTTKEYKELEEEKRVLFDKWISYRKDIKKPISNETTIKQLLKKFKAEPIEKIIQVINASIENGWQGLFWNKYNKTQNNEQITELTTSIREANPNI